MDSTLSSTNLYQKNKYGISYRYLSTSSLEEGEKDKRIEIGMDEAGRGPLFGPLFVAAVILPNALPKEVNSKSTFDFSEMRDSKKITSKKKIGVLAEYIKSNAVAWTIQSISAEEIDRINIRQAVLKAMRECARTLISSILSQGTGDSKDSKQILEDIFLLVDGNDFTPYSYFDETTDSLKPIAHDTVAGGDNLYASIACASILAKTARDAYIADLCEQNPELKTRYSIHTNMGYGTKAHLDGIAKYGITEEHRKSYKPCTTR